MHSLTLLSRHQIPPCLSTPMSKSWLNLTKLNLGSNIEVWGRPSAERQSRRLMNKALEDKKLVGTVISSHKTGRPNHMCSLRLDLIICEGYWIFWRQIVLIDLQEQRIGFGGCYWKGLNVNSNRLGRRWEFEKHILCSRHFTQIRVSFLQRFHKSGPQLHTTRVMSWQCVRYARVSNWDQ